MKNKLLKILYISTICLLFCSSLQIALAQIFGEEDTEPPSFLSLSYFDVTYWPSKDSCFVDISPKNSNKFWFRVFIRATNTGLTFGAYCDGDEGICKSIGNGKVCSGTDYTGDDLWCYKAS